MRIIFLSPSLKKGGAENQLIKLITHLVKKGVRVQIYTFVEGNDFVDLLVQMEVKVICINLRTINGFYKLLIDIRNYKPSLLITFMFSANIVGRIIKFFLKIPLVTSVRANKMSKLYKELYKVTYSLDDISTFNSNYSYENFIKEKLTKQTSSVIVNNGIVIKENYQKEDFRINKNRLQILSIAHFRKSKDYKTLFKALSILNDKGFDFEIKILGNLENQKWPFDMIKDYNIEDKVKILGYRTDGHKFLQESDVLILSSFLEGTPNAILEAMSQKIPVIASDIPGNDFLITESKGGILFECGNAIDLANKIVYLSNLEASKRQRMGELGNDYVRENYELEKVLGKWDSIIKAVVNK